jgi:hypothetical protein
MPTPYFTAGNTPAADAYWDLENPPAGTWTGNNQATYPATFKYLGRFPGFTEEMMLPFVNFDGLLVELSTDYVLWAQKSPPVQVYRVPFNPLWFVAVSSSGV